MSVRQDYRTTDLYFAAYLKATGLEFEGIHRGSGKVYFIFDYPEDLKELKKKYFGRTGKVSALTYADELQALKTLTYQ